MKKTTFLILLTLLLAVFCMADVQSIPVDKEIHFSAGLAVTVGADIIADFFGLPWYVTGVTVTAIGIGMEFGDPVFSYQDLSYYYIGFSFGFAIRYLDSLQYRERE